jgi:hypothetical protein
MALEAITSTTVASTVEQAAKAIVELINERPTSPRQDEIEAIVGRTVVQASLAPTSLSDDQDRLLEAVQEYLAAERALDESGKTTTTRDEEEPFIRRSDSAIERLNVLAAELPSPPRSLTDVVLLGLVAFCHADKHLNGRLVNLTNDEADHDEIAAARLIEAILQFVGFKH